MLPIPQLLEEKSLRLVAAMASDTQLLIDSSDEKNGNICNFVCSIHLCSTLISGFVYAQKIQILSRNNKQFSYTLI